MFYVDKCEDGKEEVIYVSPSGNKTTIKVIDKDGKEVDFLEALFK